MSYTTDDLALHVLRNLRIIDATETIGNVDADQVQLIKDVYRAKWEQITSHGQELTYWQYDEIPKPVFIIMRDLVSLEVQGSFGLPIAPADKQAAENIVLRQLRRHTSIQPTSAPVKGEYY
jgi:hypothetical protein